MVVFSSLFFIIAASLSLATTAPVLHAAEPSKAESSAEMPDFFELASSTAESLTPGFLQEAFERAQDPQSEGIGYELIESLIGSSPEQEEEESEQSIDQPLFSIPLTGDSIEADPPPYRDSVESLRTAPSNERSLDPNETIRNGIRRIARNALAKPPANFQQPRIKPFNAKPIPKKIRTQLLKAPLYKSQALSLVPLLIDMIIATIHHRVFLAERKSFLLSEYLENAEAFIIRHN